MPTELVLTSPTHPTKGEVIAALEPLYPDGVIMEYRDGEIAQLIDASGRAVLTVFRPRVMQTVDDAARAVADGIEPRSTWTDLTIPFGDPAEGRAAAEALASHIGGELHERN